MKTLFIMLGIPGAGMVSTVDTLKEFLSNDPENNISVWTRKYDVPRRYFDCKAGSMLEMRHEIYKWAQTAGDKDYGIVNIPFLTAFDRFDFIDEIDKAAKIADNELLIVAVYHERSYKYLYEVYLDKDETLSKERQIMLARYVRRMQQPIREEGFDLIYRIGGRDEMNLTQLTKMMNKITSDPFWSIENDDPNETEKHDQERDNNEEE